MNSPGSQQPLTAGDPSPGEFGSQAPLPEGAVSSLQNVGIEEVGAAVHPPQEGVSVIPSGNYPQPAPVGAVTVATAPAPAVGRAALPPQRAPRPMRTSVRGDQTEIISVLPDPSAPKRRRQRNRKAMSPMKLMGLFVVVQVVVGMLVLAFFGDLIRSWLLAGEAGAAADFSEQEAAALRTDVSEAQSRFERLGSDLDKVKKQIAVSPGDAWKQLEILGERNELTLLADDAITNGNRLAFDKLVAMAKDASREKSLRDGAAAEILRVKHFYASGTRLGSYTLPVATLYPSSKTKTEEALTTSQLIGLLGNADKPWRVRTRAAYLLGSRRNLDVCEALVKAAQTDTNLDVVKECVFTFEENTGYRAKSLFEIEDLTTWWGVYEARASLQAEDQDPS